MTNHLRSCHKKQEYLKFIELYDTEVDDEIASKHLKYVKVAISPEILQKGCLELVTVNGRPFSCMKDSGFQKIVKPILDAFPDNAPKISPEAMKQNVIAEAKKIKTDIKKDVKQNS